MNLLLGEKYQLIKADVRELKREIISDNHNNWDKIIIIYNFYIFYQFIYSSYLMLDYFEKTNAPFHTQYVQYYMFFYSICAIRHSYLYFIQNIARINVDLAVRMHNNLKEYFLY